MHPRNQVEGTEGEGGRGYRFQANMVHGDHCEQKWSGHLDQHKSLKDGVVDVKRQGDRIILVKLVVGDLILNVISAYVPQVAHNEGTKLEFWGGLEDLVRSVPIGERLFIGGDLNGHVGTSNTGFEGMHGGFGYGCRNQEGEDVLSFALAYNMIVANTLFREILI